MSPQRWSIRWRLTLWNSLVLTVLFSLFSMALLWMVHGHLLSRADRMLSEELHELLEDFRRSEGTDDLVKQLNQRFAVHSEYHFEVVDSQRQTLFRSRYLSQVELPQPPQPDQLRGSLYQDVELPEGAFRMLSLSVRDSHNHPLLLRAISPRTAMRREFAWYVGLMLAGLPITLLVSVATGHLLARQALRPLERIAETADRISTENLSERLAVDHPGDELGKLSNTLNSMFDRLRVSVTQMKQFTSDAAHELRSPLAALKTRLEVALRTNRSSQEYQHTIEETLSEANHMAELVDQLLMLSRQDSGRQADSFDEVRVDLVLRDVLERFQSLAESRNQTIQVAHLPIWLVHGDDIWVSVLFWNLLDNASKYTDPGGVISVSAHADGTHWVCTVEDTGRGIAPEHLPRIFDRFYRVDYSRTRSAGGTGLGLAICKSIVEAHQGRISVTSTVGVGSRFQVELPGHPAEPDSETIMISNCSHVQ